MPEASLLACEWQCLQRDHEQYETHALWIKLAAISVSVLTFAVVLDRRLGGALILVLWLQEAIGRTGQARVGERLLQLEALLREPIANPAAAMQLHTQWRRSRGGPATLLKEYAIQAMRPTVAFPYVVLVVLLLATTLLPAG